MIKRADKIRIGIEKYGLTEKEATRIAREQDFLLTLDELRIKYDNPNLGNNYPDWLTPDDLYKMCCTTVRTAYNKNFAEICTPTELASILFIKASIKLDTFKNFSYLKGALVTMTMQILRDHRVHSKINGGSLDKILGTFVDGSGFSGLDVLSNHTIDYEAEKCLIDVMSIKNREVREMLIVAGYIIGDIDEFKDEFEKIVYNSDLVRKDELVELMKQVVENDCIMVDRKENNVRGTKLHKITFKNILKVFKSDMDLKTARQELGYYLTLSGFMLPRHI